MKSSLFLRYQCIPDRVEIGEGRCDVSFVNLLRLQIVQFGQNLGRPFVGKSQALLKVRDPGQ